MAATAKQSDPMRLIGYWIDGLQDNDYLPPQEFVRPYGNLDREALADYLDHGDIFASYRGTSWCRFFCSHKMGWREFSDGCWVWPEDLGHYVRQHGVALPEEFVGHVRMGKPRVPEHLWNRRVDEIFWKNWCRQNSLGRYQTQITVARLRADKEAETLLAAALAAMEHKEGASTQRCLWSGCANNALLGRALCARCILRGQEDVIVGAAYSEKLRAILVPQRNT